MQHISFSPRAAISFGWNTFMQQKKFWIIAAILFSVLGSSGGNINLGDKKDSKPTSTQVEQSEMPSLNNFINKEYQTGDASLPLVPERVDNVLGISDMKDNGNFLGFILLFVLVAFIFALPYIIAVVLVSGAIQMGFLKFFLTAAREQTTKYEIILSEVNLGKSWRFLVTSFLYALLVIVGTILFIIPGIYFAVKYGLSLYFIVDRDAKIGEAFSLSSQATKGQKWNLLGLGILIILINIVGFIALLYGLLVTIPVTMLASAYAYNKLSSSKSE